MMLSQDCLLVIAYLQVMGLVVAEVVNALTVAAASKHALEIAATFDQLETKSPLWLGVCWVGWWVGSPVLGCLPRVERARPTERRGSVMGQQPLLCTASFGLLMTKEKLAGGFALC